MSSGFSALAQILAEAADDIGAALSQSHCL
jgi:hypothetical protein